MPFLTDCRRSGFAGWVAFCLLGLSACAPGSGSGDPRFLGPPVAAPGQPLAACGADLLIGLVGAPVARLPAQPADRTVRILRPGDPVTEDFSEQRLNVILDDRDRMTAVSCG